jgi:molybdopterin-synthase adenylyltransferase
MSDRFSRQSFLGPGAQAAFENCRVGILGLGGGGSHVVQQLAHIGFTNLVIFDPDVANDVNLNRLVGATEFDVCWHLPKVAIAARVVKAIRSDANVEVHQCRWQDEPLALRGCDIVFGCIDGFAERREAEACCRRFLIPFIDIGLDVHITEGEPPQMAGQVIASVPGGPCMTCLGFLTEQRLAQEAAQYGAAGPRPQVVWANGVLASSAVGIAINLLTGWAGRNATIYFSYDANDGTLRPHPRLPFLDLRRPCSHYPDSDVGEPRFSPA